MSKKQLREVAYMLSQVFQGKDTRLSDSDKLFLTALPNENTRLMWLTRFAKGLSPSEKQWVAARTKELV